MLKIIEKMIQRIFQGGRWALPVFILTFASCGQKAADVANPKTFSQDGVSFSYPANWTVDYAPESDESAQYLIVETPGEAIFMANFFPIEEAQDVASFAEFFSGLAEEKLPYGKGETFGFVPIEFSGENQRLQGVEESFSVTVLETDVPHLRRYFSLDGPEQRVFLISQSATEDWDLSEPGFDLILNTFEIE